MTNLRQKLHLPSVDIGSKSLRGANMPIAYSTVIKSKLELVYEIINY